MICQLRSAILAISFTNMKKDIYIPDPVFNDLPETLKNPRCYKRVLKKILQAGESDHKHADPSRWLTCQVCQDAFNHKRNVLKEVGFSSYNQFLRWRKVMGIIHYYKKNGKTTKSKRGTQGKKVS